MPTKPDPIIFGDLRDRDTAEKKSLRRKHQLLTIQIPKKRALTDQEVAEAQEIDEKLLITASARFKELTEIERGRALTSDETKEKAALDQKLKDQDQAQDPLFRAIQADLRSTVVHKGGLLPSQASNPGSPTDDEKLLVGVFGLLQLDRVKPPPFHPPGVSFFIDPDERRKKQQFGKAVFAAQGEYMTNEALFNAVLPILVRIGEQGAEDEVNATEWANVVRRLVAKGITEKEPQLTRRVNEALDAIQNVGEDRPPSDIDIDLPSLDDSETIDSEIVGDNIRALQPAYFAAMFEELKVFQVVDKLVELFQNGILPIGRGSAGNNLFKYWKQTALRISEAERRSFYARSLGIPGGDDGGMPNREFNDLFLRFVSAVSSFVRQNSLDELLQTKIPGSISQQKIRKAGRDLAMNLSLHGYGMAYFMATDLQNQIKDVMEVLSDPDIKNAYGARDMWQVIDQVAALELGGARNSVRYRTMAAAGTIILAWLAKNARELSNSSFGTLLDIDEIRSPSPRPAGTKATVDPTDFDLVNACDQWLAVTATQDVDVEAYAQPRESPNMTSKPIQIPDMARETLESVGIPALGYSGNGRKY